MATQRKYTRCSQCGYRVKARWLEVMWRDVWLGPWHFVGGWFCAPCRRAFIGFIEGSFQLHELVAD